MEAIILIGIHATGKSSFYLEGFFRTHVRINGDMLTTHRRENLLIKACLEGKTPFVADKMIITRADRAAYIGLAKAAGFKISGYFSNLIWPLLFRATRVGIRLNGFPEGGVRAASKVFRSPSSSEGFDQLFAVRMNGRVGSKWRN